MPVIVVAIMKPQPGRTQDVLDAFAAVSADVHNEAGCELYATHTDGENVVIIERWTTRADLAAHAAGEPLVELRRLRGDALAEPEVVHVLENVPMGDAVKGVIQ